MNYILNENTSLLKNQNILKNKKDFLRNLKFQINYFIKNKKNYLLNIYLAKLYKFYKTNNKQTIFFKYIDKKLKYLEKISILTKLVFYKYKLLFYIDYNQVFNTDSIYDFSKNTQEISENMLKNNSKHQKFKKAKSKQNEYKKYKFNIDFYGDLKNTFSLITAYVFNLLKEIVIIFYDVKAYELIFSFESNKNLIDYEQKIYQKLLQKNNFNIQKLKKLLYFIFFIYREFYFLDKLDFQDLNNLKNLKLFLFYLGFFKEYLYFNFDQEFLTLENNLQYSIDSYKNLINNFVSIIDEIIR